MEKFKVARLTYQMTRSMSDHSLQRHADAARKRRDTFQTTPSTDVDELLTSVENEERVCEKEAEGVRCRKQNGSFLTADLSPKRLSSTSERKFM